MESELQNGLRLRQATKNDLKQVAKFNGLIHEEPDIKGRIEAWTADLMGGSHPTTKAEDFLIVETEAGEIVSSTCIIPQVWFYEDVPIKVGRPELVGTLEAWRKKGLVRETFKVLHKLSEGNGDLMQVITGIPWYYRLFGYSHALDLGGSRLFDWSRPGNLKQIEAKDEPFRWRESTSKDISFLQKYYDLHCQNYMINSQRDEAQWRFIFEKQSPESIHEKFFWTITEPDGTPAGYIVFTQWPVAISILEIACEPGHSMREFCLFVTRALHRYAEDALAKAEQSGEKPPLNKRLIFYLGQNHSAYTALPMELGKQSKSYAWYIRIPDLSAFLWHIRPVLERRLASSVMAGYTGKHKVNLYQEQFELIFDNGQLIEIGDYERKQPQDGHTCFSRPEFIQLVCGHKSFEELNNTHPDCLGNNEAWVLMNILFPKKYSQPTGVW